MQRRPGRAGSRRGAASGGSCGRRAASTSIHLRMADVGSMAAAEVAAELDIPVVLTLAPDPQALSPRGRRTAP